MNFDDYVVRVKRGGKSLIISAVDGKRVLFGTFEAAAMPCGVFRGVGHIGGNRAAVCLRIKL